MIIQTILITSALLMFKNKSNFPTEYVVPLITLLLIKYLGGDWDTGYRWTFNDLYYVLFILGISYMTVKIYNG